MPRWALHERPGHLTIRASRLFLRLGEARFREFGLGVASFPVLNLLRTGEKRSQKDLALYVQIEQPSMAQLLARLERDGMIKRSPDPNDGRSSLISLTRKALDILPKIDEMADAANDEAVAGMSAAEIKILIDLLQRLIANLETLAKRE